MAKTRLVYFATPFLGLAALILLHFIDISWAQLLVAVLLSGFAFGTGFVVGFVERGR